MFFLFSLLISGLWSSVFKFIKPYLIKGSKAVGSELLRSGTELIDSYGSKPIGELLKEQKDKSFKNLEERVEKHMTGSGYKRKGKRRRKSVAKKKSVKRIQKKKLKRKPKKISRKKKKGKANFLKEYLLKK